MKKFNTFTAYATDEYGLPVFQTDTASELASWLGVSSKHLWYCVKHGDLCNGYEVHADVIVD